MKKIRCFYLNFHLNENSKCFDKFVTVNVTTSTHQRCKEISTIETFLLDEFFFFFASCLRNYSRNFVLTNRRKENMSFRSVLWFKCAHSERLSARMGVCHWERGRETEKSREKWVRHPNLTYSASHELWPHVIRQRLEHINFHISKCYSHSYQESCTQMIAINLDLSRQL